MMDFAKLAHDLGLDEDEYAQFLEQFLRTTHSNIRKLQSAIDSGDVKGVVGAAHNIKGVSLNLGFMEISELAKGVEEKARHNNLEGLVEAVGSIKEKCDQVAEKLQGRGEQESKSKKTEAVKIKKKKVMIVDNQPELLRFMTSLLEKRSCEVVTAEDSLSALEMLKAYIPEVIFIDLIMPNITGDKLCQIIRGIPELKDVPLIILSAVAREQELNFAQFGANACIAKGPFNKMAEHILYVLDQLEKGILSDLTEKVLGLHDVNSRSITKELLLLKKRLEVILGSMSEGIMELSSEGRIVFANPAALDLLGLAEEKVLASYFIDQFQGTDRRRIENLLQAVDNTPQTISKDLPVVLHDKQVSLNIIPITDEEHKPIIVILTDVSKQRRMEAQLRHAQKMESIGTLAGGIAHDFNNILMVILGNAQLLSMDIPPIDPNYELVKEIESRAKVGSNLTSQLLSFARSGKYKVRPFNINDVVQESSTAFGRTRKEITIYRRLRENLSPIEADIGQIEQVLMNLYVNAAQAMPNGGDLYLETRTVSHRDIENKPFRIEPSKYLLISVTDTGAGMDKATQERIFDPFFTTKELGRGTGLGLASVYGIIKSHKGYIDVESEIGCGTTFNIYLPVSEKKLTTSVKVPDHVVKGTETILLVDDEESVLKLGGKILDRLGYNILEARNGHEAVDVYRVHKNKIDLVILDMIMPDMGGGAVYDRIKMIKPDVKVILSSGYSAEGQAAAILERGCNGFIQKPFSIKYLSQKIREVLDKS